MLTLGPANRHVQGVSRIHGWLIDLCICFLMCRVLYGQLQVKAYDWIEDQALLDYGELQSAKLSVQAALTKDDRPLVLFPRVGNIHSLHALSNCAVLDVLAPPYDQTAPGQVLHILPASISCAGILSSQELPVGQSR